MLRLPLPFKSRLLEIVVEFRDQAALLTREFPIQQGLLGLLEAPGINQLPDPLRLECQCNLPDFCGIGSPAFGKPALASVGLYVFMIAWNEFLFAFMFLDSPEIFTLSRGMVSLNSSEVPRQYLMAGAVMVTVPVMALFFWFEKYLVSGLTAGSVKG